MTVDHSIQVPDKVLAPGQYVFKLADSQSDRHIVQIFNRDESHIITTILAIPNYRLRPTGKSEFRFWETPAGEPRALRAWFYPGDNFGQEFAYRPAEFSRIMSYRSTPATVTYSPVVRETETTTVQQSTVEQSPAPYEVEPNTVIARNAPPAPAPEPTPAPAPEPAPQVTQASEPAPAAPAELPRTGSYYPLIMLVGVLSLLAFVVTTLLSKRSL